MSCTTQENHKTGILHHWRSMVLVLGLTLIFVLILSLGGTGEQGAPPTNGATIDDWIIENGDNVVRDDETLSIGGNIIIQNGGELVFSNIDIEFMENDDDPYYYKVAVKEGGIFSVNNESRISTPWDGAIFSEPGSTCSFSDSSIDDIRIELWHKATISNCEMMNISHLSCLYGSYKMTDNTIQFKDLFEGEYNKPNGLDFNNCQEIFIENNSIESKRSNAIFYSTNGTISNNTFRHDDQCRMGIAVVDSSNITLYQNVFKNNRFGIHINVGSHNIDVNYNHFLSNNQGVTIKGNSFAVEVRNNTFTDSTRNGIILNRWSHLISIHNNTFHQSERGIGLFNGSDIVHIQNNTFSDILIAICHLNCILAHEQDNVFHNVTLELWQGSELFLRITDQYFRPLENCNVMVCNAADDDQYQFKSKEDGSIPWFNQPYLQRTSEGTIYYNPHYVIVETMGVRKTTYFNISATNSLTVSVQLTIIFEVTVSVLPLESTYERGTFVPVNVTFENTGTVNFSSSKVRIDITSDDSSYSIKNLTFENNTVGTCFTIQSSWYIDAIIDPGTFHLVINVDSTSRYSEDHYFEHIDIPFDVFNSPPSIDPDILTDLNMTAWKNEVIVIDLFPYLLDFEDDVENLTVLMTDLLEFEEVDISMRRKTISITPSLQISGTILANITVMDRDGSQFTLPVPLTWINRAPAFLPRENFTWITLQRTLALNLAELVADEDLKETLSWIYSSDDQEQGSIQLMLENEILSITQTAHDITSTEINLMVSDSSNASSSQIVTIIWKVDVTLSNIEITHENETIMHEERIDIAFFIIASNDVLVNVDLFCYLDVNDTILWSQSLDIGEQRERTIIIPWIAVHGEHDIILFMEVNSPYDDDLTDHELSLPVKVYLPLILHCEDQTSIPVTIHQGNDGNSIRVEVIAPQIKSVVNVTILVSDLTIGGEVCDTILEDIELNGEVELVDGLTISVTPPRRKINAASSGIYTIIIRINETVNCSTDDLIELCLYAEGDDGRSNHVVLHISVKAKDGKSASNVPMLNHTTVILIVGAVLLSLGAVKASSIMSNIFYPMYRLCHLLFLRFPGFFTFLCPLATKYFEDDEARYNEYRDEICKFLEARGEQGATIHEVMTHLKKWLPYGTTGNANPEDDRVTGVVREHINVLRKKKYIKLLGDRYYYRSYQPAFPEDVYTPEINWKTFLRDDQFKLKGETICQLISTFYKKGNEGLKNKELANMMDMTPYALHYHIRKLENHKIIEKRKGQGKRYFLRTETIKFIFRTPPPYFFAFFP